MSLQTDTVFIQSLQGTPAVVEQTGGRIYGTAIPLPDEQAANVPLPYVIVSFEGMENDADTKDTDASEGGEDVCTVSVVLCAATLTDLHRLAHTVRLALRDTVGRPADGKNPLLADWPLAYRLTASPVAFDPLKPAFWITLTYRCQTPADL